MERSTTIAGDERRRVVAGLVGAAAGEGGRAPRATGSSTKRGQILGTVTATLASLAPRYGSERSAEFARVDSLCPTLPRAREAPSSGAGRPTRLLADSDAPDFSFYGSRIGANDGARAVSGAGEVANDAEVDGAANSFLAEFLFRKSGSGSGPTMELERSAALVRWRTMERSTTIAGDERRRVGAGLVGAAAGEVGGERRELRGHQQNAAKFSSTVTVRLPRSRYGSERSAEFARGAPASSAFTRAREAPSSGAGRPTRLLADSDAPDSFFRDFRIGANDGARAVSGDAEVANDAEVDGDAVDGAGGATCRCWPGRGGGERRRGVRGDQQSAAKF